MSSGPKYAGGRISVSTIAATVTITGTATALPTGTQNVSVVNTPVVTATVSNNPLIVTAANITVASITTGTVSVSNTPVVTATVSNNPVFVSGSGLILAALPAGTNTVGRVELMHHDSRISNYVSTATTGNVILLTSGGHTFYIQDLLVSPSTAMNITLFSAATTAVAPLYFATQGGAHIAFVQPLKLNSNQSLTFTPSVAASVSLYAGGYTVT